MQQAPIGANSPFAPPAAPSLLAGEAGGFQRRQAGLADQPLRAEAGQDFRRVAGEQFLGRELAQQRAEGDAAMGGDRVDLAAVAEESGDRKAVGRHRALADAKRLQSDAFGARKQVRQARAQLADVVAVRGGRVRRVGVRVQVQALDHQAAAAVRADVQLRRGQHPVEPGGQRVRLTSSLS
ncbi:hypothetical protein [Saccharopolyspora pogona]|uniref:hypothetical protein n=1 Tax=Saccharopolyspora pogona TaxID=333966 RepID=UPI001CC224E7|nr:hypothetical protein [Saccharopolyspora pogona]